jgi:hypothetical protein
MCTQKLPSRITHDFDNEHRHAIRGSTISNQKSALLVQKRRFYGSGSTSFSPRDDGASTHLACTGKGRTSCLIRDIPSISICPNHRITRPIITAAPYPTTISAATAKQLGCDEHPTTASTSNAQPPSCASNVCKLKKTFPTAD